MNQNSEARARFQFDLLSEEIDTKTAQQNALLGLPPGSQSEKLASLKMKQDALKSIELDLTQNQLQGELGITEKIGDEKKTISMARVALESSQGEKKEGLAQSLFNLDLSFGDKKESILGQRGNALLATEQSKQSQLLNAAYGNIPMMMQAGQGAMGFEQAQKASEAGMFGSILAPVSHARDIEEQRTMA